MVVTRRVDDVEVYVRGVDKGVFKLTCHLPLNHFVDCYSKDG